MQYLLKSWLTSLGPRPLVRKDASQRLEPAVVPPRYVCEELTTEFANYWTKIQEDDNEGLEEIQLSALIRWHAFRFKFGKSTEEQPLPLDFFVDIFDDYFFLGALRQYIKVKLADDTPANSGWVGITKRKESCISSATREIQIEVKRQPNQLWTHKLVQEYLDTLLHEMIHAFLILYSAPVASQGCHHRTVETEGLTGHGPCWVKVAAAVAAEADRSLGVLWHKWDLGIASARLSEEGALRRSNELKGLNMMDKESG